MKKSVLGSSVFVVLGIILTSCASIVDTQKVQMTVKTPGAENAKCYLENPDHKYMAYSGQTVEVMKSYHDLIVRCMAPGNREKTVLVKRHLNEWVLVNVANGFIPGMAYDVVSRGAFDYPDEVVVHFEDEAVKPYPLPEYMAEDIRPQGYQGKMERYGSSSVITEADRYHTPQGLQKKRVVQTDVIETTPIAPASKAPIDVPLVSYDPTEEDK